jgi:hypothetical protein
VTFVTYLMLTRVCCLASDLSLRPRMRAWRGTPARHASWRCVSLVGLPNWEVGGSVDRVSCLIVLQTFALERFKRFAFERSQITVPSWHGFALSQFHWSCACINKTLVFVFASTFVVERFMRTALLRRCLDTSRR